MNSKKTNRYSYGTKSRGIRRELVRLNAAKVSNRERILNEQRSSNGVYEDVMVYVKDQVITTRKPRGRPRKFQLENNLNQPAVRSSQPEIIYLPSVGQRSNERSLITPLQNQEGAGSYSQILLKHSSQSKKVLSSKSGVKTILGTNSHTHSSLRSTLLNSSNQSASGSNLLNQKLLKAKHCSQVVFESNSYSQTALRQKSGSQNISGSSIQSQTLLKSSHLCKTSLGCNLNPQSVLKSNQILIGLNTQSHVDKSILEAHPAAGTRPVTTKESEDDNSWPRDLQELWDTWDQFPEREVNRWLKAPLSSSDHLPSVVVSIHQLVDEWDENEETKLQVIGDLLLDKQDLPQTVSTEPPPKVVVEVQPNSQHCGLWSSMDDFTE